MEYRDMQAGKVYFQHSKGDNRYLTYVHSDRAETFICYERYLSKSNTILHTAGSSSGQYIEIREATEDEANYLIQAMRSNGEQVELIKSLNYEFY